MLSQETKRKNLITAVNKNCIQQQIYLQLYLFIEKEVRPFPTGWVFGRGEEKGRGGGAGGGGGGGEGKYKKIF